ncbi:MAG: Asd/ArgC dimerization domain-containing protein [Candidatus Aminicenantes bacterium]|jgi:aspartate-semialdehyde dehydrogenase
MSTHKGFRFALVGSDTFRGKELTGLLNKRKIQIREMEFYDPGIVEEFSKLTQFRGEPKVVHHLDENAFEGIDLAFFAADPQTNLEFGPLASKKKNWVIDLSEAFNRDIKVPLVVAGVNDGVLQKKKHGIVANPHPVTIFLSHLFHLLQKSFGLEEADATVLQPVSAFADSGIVELANQCFDVLRGSQIEKKVFKTQIAFNLLSQIEEVNSDGLAAGEEQLIYEIRRVLDTSELRLALSLIQAPVFHTYSIMTRCLLGREVSVADLEDLFKNTQNFELGSSIPSSPTTSVDVAGKDQIYVGRIKSDTSFPRSFWIWIVADNLTRGSSVNALEIAEAILSRPPN